MRSHYAGIVPRAWRQQYGAGGIGEKHAVRPVALVDTARQNIGGDDKNSRSLRTHEAVRQRQRINETRTCPSHVDAAGAVLLAPSARNNAGVVGAHLASKGQHYDLITIPGGGSRKPFAQVRDPQEVLMVMNDGKAVYAGAVAMMTESAEKALAKARLSATDVDHLIPHQANARMMNTIARQLDIPPERLRSTIGNFGNSSAATIPFTLSATAADRPYTQGDILLMTAAGAGLTGGAAIFRW